MRLDVLLDRHISSITWYLVLLLRKCVFGNLLFFVTTMYDSRAVERLLLSKPKKSQRFLLFAFGKKKNKFLCYGLLKANKNHHVFCRGQSRDIKERVSVSFSLSLSLSRF